MTRLSFKCLRQSTWRSAASRLIRRDRQQRPLNKLRLIPGGVDALVVHMGLPDRKGDALVQEVRSIYPTLPIVIASGQGRQALQQLFKDVANLTFVINPTLQMS